MRARLTYLALSPRTPERLAAGITHLLVLLAVTVAMIAVLAGYSPVVGLGHLIVITGDILGVQA